MRHPKINIYRHLNIHVLELITILEKNSRVTKISMGQKIDLGEYQHFMVALGEEYRH